MYVQLKNMPVHRSMREISELIFETCKTYLVTQGKVHPHPRGLHRRRDLRLFLHPAAASTSPR